MRKQHWAILIVMVALVAATAVLLLQFQRSQRLGQPGVKTIPLAGSSNLKVVLPAKVLDFKGEFLEPEASTVATLPADTSYGQARYTAEDGFVTLMNVVLMGRDRTSLHKPQFCLAGMGWGIDGSCSAEDKIRIQRSGEPGYDLPVVKLVTSKQIEQDGQVVLARGVYVYWYAADDAVSASVTGFERMWWMAAHLFRTGVLQRWAYVSCFAVCAPGQEDATYERMKRFVAAAVPEFQKRPGGSAAAFTANR